MFFFGFGRLAVVGCLLFVCANKRVYTVGFRCVVIISPVGLGAGFLSFFVSFFL